MIINLQLNLKKPLEKISTLTSKRTDKNPLYNNITYFLKQKKLFTQTGIQFHAFAFPPEKQFSLVLKDLPQIKITIPYNKFLTKRNSTKLIENIKFLYIIEQNV